MEIFKAECIFVSRDLWEAQLIMERKGHIYNMKALERTENNRNWNVSANVSTRWKK